jgi:hypothetical protein
MPRSSSQRLRLSVSSAVRLNTGHFTLDKFYGFIMSVSRATGDDGIIRKPVEPKPRCFLAEPDAGCAVS